MARLIVLAQGPHRLSAAEAEAWLRNEARALWTLEGVTCVEVLRLTSPSPMWSKQRDWMIEIRCESREAAVGAAGQEAWLALLHDFHQLGMGPDLALVEASSAAFGDVVADVSRCA